MSLSPAMPRLLFGIILALVILPGCREETPAKAVLVREDGVLELQLASFNVRYEGGKDKGWKSWPNRIDRVLGAVRTMDPDVMGIQEAFHGQVADLMVSLPDYGFHGVGRDDGRAAGEYPGIFWKKDRFQLDDYGTFWLSDTPETPGSRTWGNSVVRSTGWVRLIDKTTNRGFYVYNTHWDHRHQGSREKAAMLIASRIDSRTHGGDPVVLLGDFNAVENNPAVRYFRGESAKLSGRVVDGWNGAYSDPFAELHPLIKNRRTLHFWTGDSTGWAKVDHILVSPGAQALEAGIFRADTRETQPSDHFPVWASVAWPPSESTQETTASTISKR